MRFARSPLWPWVKVVVLLVALDWVLFDAGLFFRLVPSIRRFPVTWGLVYDCVRQLAAPPPAPLAWIAGSSIVFLGVDDRLVREALHERKVETSFGRLTVFGAGGVDQALLAHAAIDTRPWLVVFTAAVRDFPAKGPLDTPVARVFRDDSVTFPGLRPHDAEGMLAGVVRRHWGLYRHRFFARLALDENVTRLVGSVMPRLVTPLPPPGPLVIPSASGAPVPAEAFEFFHPGRVSAESWAAWTKWRGTRSFADYQWFLALNQSAAIDQYGRQTFETHGPATNAHLDALAWSMRELHASGIRFVVLDFPENPVLDDVQARAHYDTALSDAVAARLAGEAAAAGGRFVDLRRALPPEDFYDLIHPNVAGCRDLSRLVGEIVAEEWEAAKVAGR